MSFLSTGIIAVTSSQDFNELSGLSVYDLLARRGGLASGMGDVEQLLAGSLVQQTRRCGRAGCRCADGAPHGPYAYFAPRHGGRGRLSYVPRGFVAVVGACLMRGAHVEAALAEISAINTELLARRKLE